jgi:aspartate/methionine/tyrosine aminotransferase
MTNILLAKPQLSSDVIDASVGEAYVVRDILFKYLEQSCFPFRLDDPIHHPHLYEYPESYGYPSLVQFLEDKYQAPVIITNGAKQALGACFYALHQMGNTKIGMRYPYWALLPPLITMHGLDYSISEYYQQLFVDSYLCVAPNNPDGWMQKDNYSLSLGLRQLMEDGVSVIHDAAYYTHTYLPEHYPLDVISDAQIYSASKMFGLSGLRIGWVVCPNVEMYRHIAYYMETMTVGVSNLSQVFLNDLMRFLHSCPAVAVRFTRDSRQALYKAKQMVKQIDPTILEVSNNQEDIPGMFLWAKVGLRADFVKAKVNVIDGRYFGMSGYVRLNLALPEVQLQEVIDRLNSVKET